MIDFTRPHSKLLSFKILSENFFLSMDSFFSLVVSDFAPASEESSKTVPVDSVPTISGNSHLLLLSLMVGFPESHGCAVESQSLFKVKESLDATVVLVFYFLKVENLSLLFLNSLDELIDISLFLVAVYLIVVLVLDDVGFLHQFIFFEKI